MMTVTRHVSRDRGRFAISWFKMHAAGRDESDNMAERLGSEGLGMGNLGFVACYNRCSLITWKYVYRSMIKVAVQQILVSLLDFKKTV